MKSENIKNEALEAALYWLEAEAKDPGQAQPVDICKTLRKALGLDPERVANSEFESVSRFYNNANAEPKRLYLSAFVDGDGGVTDNPEFALIVLDQTFLDHINRLSLLMHRNPDLIHVTACASPFAWRPDAEGEETFQGRLSSHQLNVSNSGFWFRSLGKLDFAIETVEVSWKSLRLLLDRPETAVYQPAYDDEPLASLIADVWADAKADAEAEAEATTET